MRAVDRAGLSSLLSDFQSDAVLIIDEHSVVVAANVAVVRRTGFSLAECYGITLENIVQPGYILRFRAGVDDALSGDGVRLETVGVKKNGEGCALAVTFIPLRNDAGLVVGAMVLTQNLTEVEDSAAARAQNSQLLALAGRVAGFSGWSLNVATGAIVWSERANRTTHSRPNHLYELFALCSPADAATFERQMLRSIDHGASIDLTVRIASTAEKVRHVRFVAEPHHGRSGVVDAISGAAHDVSEMVVAQANRREVETLLESTLNEMTDGLVIVDDSWKITFVNSHLADMVGSDVSALLGNSMWEAVPDLDGTELAASFRAAVERQTTVRIKYEWVDRGMWVDSTAYPSRGGLAIHLSDVTELEEASSRVRTVEARVAMLSRLVDISRDAIVVRSVTGHIIYANDGACSLFGWSGDEVVGTDNPFPTDAHEYDAAWDSTLESGSWSGTMRLVSAERKKAIVFTRWQLLPSGGGAEDTVLTVTADISDQVHRDEALRRIDRMESLGNFASGIAHDLNNVLTPILMASQLLSLSAESEDQKESIAVIEAAARRAADMIRQVLAYSTGIQSRSDVVDLGVLFAELLNLVAESIPQRIRFEAEVAHPPVSVLGDSTQLLQVLVNLSLNARDAIDGPGSIAVSARYADSVGSPTLRQAGGRDVVIEVSDTGHGMSPETIERLFEPFFTTKDVGNGTGLGLSMASAIVRSHGGELTAHSDGDQGSTFSLSIPSRLMPNQVTRKSTVEPPGAYDSRADGELVLVVDDDGEIRSTIRRVLEKYGYQVQLASDGAKAIELLGADVVLPSVVLTDISMPVTHGLELEQWLFTNSPQIPVILVSGNKAIDTIPAEVANRISSFVEKPFSADRLIAAVGIAVESSRRVVS
ncbi:MAG: PAS domain-containing protein [Microbacteriaceae bacterium]